MFDSTALEFGLINTLSTGNAFTDLVLCVAIPMVIQRIAQSRDNASTVLKRVHDRVVRVITGRTYVTHTVELVEQLARYGRIRRENGHDSKNGLLQKALTLFIANHVNLLNNHARYEIVNKKYEHPPSSTNDDDDETASEIEDDLSFLNSEDPLADLSVGVLPPMKTWIPLDNGIEFMQEVISTGEPSKENPIQEEKTLFHFRALRTAKGSDKIDEFIQKAFEYYEAIELNKQAKDTARYMYIRDTGMDTSTDIGDAANNDEDSTDTMGGVRHKRYVLGEDKTFDNLFFDEKEQLLTLLEDFTHRKGKFAITGFPYKLGLLLHGPPGTGKSSLIKAIAQHTGRHILSIPLSKIKTNQELMEAMFDLRFTIDGLDLPVKLTFQNVIIVMEDIDCATSVVASRSDEEKKQEQEEASDSVMDIQLLTALLLSSSQQAAGGQSISTDLIHDQLRASGFVASNNSSDKLNLAGLLNALDGVIDSPGRMVIMTTNHPEKLDPALIRPGRVNKKLFLGVISATQLQNMLEYYFRTSLTPSQAKQLVDITRKHAFTPAEVEELCAECETIDAILDRLHTDRE